MLVKRFFCVLIDKHVSHHCLSLFYRLLNYETICREGDGFVVLGYAEALTFHSVIEGKSICRAPGC